jgi:hypothetical protein
MKPLPRGADVFWPKSDCGGGILLQLKHGFREAATGSRNFISWDGVSSMKVKKIVLAKFSDILKGG